MKRNILLIFALICLSSCFSDQSHPVDPKLKDINPLSGTWKMVYAEIRQQDSLDIKDMSKADFVKIINATHFAFFNQDHNDIKGFYGGGGTYTLEGNQYTETLDYTGAEEVKGHSFPFTVEIKGDTLIQSGLEEVKAANIKRNIVEKYIRL